MLFHEYHLSLRIIRYSNKLWAENQKADLANPLAAQSAVAAKRVVIKYLFLVLIYCSSRRVGWHYFEAYDEWKRHRPRVEAMALQNFQLI